MAAGNHLLRALDLKRQLEDTEPASGFASRLAALNGRRLGRFLRDMGLQPREVDLGEPRAVRDVAVLGGCDAGRLQAFTPRRVTDKTFALGGEMLDRASINRTFFRFCPHCISEDLKRYGDGPVNSRPWLRLEWIIDHALVCNQHGTMLVAAQPERDRFEPFDFGHAMIGIVAGLDGHLRQSAEAEASAFQDWIVDRVRGRRDPANWLDDVPLHAAIAACHGFGLSAIHPPKVRTSKLRPQDLAEAANVGFSILSAGESSFRDLLTELNAAQASTRGYWGLRDTYGYGYGQLQKTVDDPAYAKFRDVVRNFALETVPVEPGTDVLGVVTEGRKLHTVRSAALASGAHSRTVRRLFARKGIAGTREETGLTDHRVLVDAYGLDGTLADLKGALSTPQAMQHTGMPRQHFAKAIAANYVATVMGTNNVVNAKHRFTVAALDAMMAKLFEGAVEVERPQGRQMPVSDARRAATCSIEDILAKVFDGGLAWKGRLKGRMDYGALLLDADELVRMTRVEGPKANLTRLEAYAYIPGMGQKSVQRFIDAGMLDTVMEFSTDARRMIEVVTRESADDFIVNYVTLGELCRTWDRHQKQVLKILRAAGVDTCVNAKEFGTLLFNRTEVEESVGAPA